MVVVSNGTIITDSTTTIFNRGHGLLRINIIIRDCGGHQGVFKSWGQLSDIITP